MQRIDDVVKCIDFTFAYRITKKLVSLIHKRASLPLGVCFHGRCVTYKPERRPQPQQESAHIRLIITLEQTTLACYLLIRIDVSGIRQIPNDGHNFELTGFGETSIARVCAQHMSAGENFIDGIRDGLSKNGVCAF